MFPRSYYAPNLHCGSYFYQPHARDVIDAAAQYQKETKLRSAHSDKRRVLLLLIDVQRDFCHKEGPLFVAGRNGDGAIEDNFRLVSFLYQELSHITSIAATLDTHLPFQIFTPSFWFDQYGKQLLPHDQINEEMHVVRNGMVTELVAHVNPPLGYEVSGGAVDPHWLEEHARYYCRELVSRNKPMLYIWPEHCQEGTIGHGLVGSVQEAMMFHSFVRSTNYKLVKKGDNPLTECYSVFGPEIMDSFDHIPIDQKNIKLLEYAASFDSVIVAGQAFSHCVRSSVDDLIAYMKSKHPQRVGGIRILTDCMSPVVVPEALVDTTDVCTAASKRWQEEGVQLVESTKSQEWLHS